MYGTPPIQTSENSENGGTRFYSDSEVTALIEEISEAAESVIEKAAAEGAKAAALASLDREAAALAEVQRYRREVEAIRKQGNRKALIAGVICFFAGALAGTVLQNCLP
ncbi:hypothetical protein FACS189468_7240 [Spirochaetia bacterium]|nr:hypothetical protein FACS189468_7240 [Spirochaetia bacterium]